ncbi:hypothetical protein, partial [Leptolyngbya ectocarpi]|uniref:hypothetical protein n=1 Tax=Leptolyngbya ectocarpi TaxID=1202 RepID=UPI001D14B465
RIACGLFGGSCHGRCTRLHCCAVRLARLPGAGHQWRTLARPRRSGHPRQPAPAPGALHLAG